MARSGPPSDSAAFWEERASWYAGVRAPSAVDRRVLREVPPRGEVLELGAGHGVFTRQLLAHPDRDPDRRVVVTDLCGPFCRQLRELPVEVRQADHRELVFSEGAFHTVYAMATLHHLPPRDGGAVLARVARWLHPGGVLALVEDWAAPPENESQRRLFALRAALRRREDPDEVHPSEAAWQARLEQAGLAVAARHRELRREPLDRYRSLADPESRAHLAWLDRRGGPHRVPMSIFVARGSGP